MWYVSDTTNEKAEVINKHYDIDRKIETLYENFPGACLQESLMCHVNTVRSWYIAVIFLSITHERRPISRS